MNEHQVFDLIADSRDVTVGGGSASALATAMAAGLVGMVARLSVAKGDKTYGLTDAEYLAVAAKMDEVAAAAKKGAVDDAGAYMGIKNAYALPKESDEEKAARRAAIENAGVAAANVPIANGRLALAVLEAIKKIDGAFNTNAASDMECGKMLAFMAVKGCALNVEANLPLIKRQDNRDKIEKALAELAG